MIIIKLQGGLGNQMFQYAFGMALSLKQKTQLFFDDSFFYQEHAFAVRKYQLNVFDIKVNIADEKLINKILKPGKIQRLKNKIDYGKCVIYNEPSLKYNYEILDISPPVYFNGFWQSEKYFMEYQKEIKRGFTFKALLNTHSAKQAGIIDQQPNSVSIHIRRGDYISAKTTNEIHGACTLNYYNAAIKLIKQRIDNPAFYLFSDDAEWVQQKLLPGMDNTTIIQHNEGDDSWQDMALMSRCSHHIIANSSFSWWGAWLDLNNNKMVIAPQKWFNTPSAYFNAADIIPAEWIQLPDE